MNEAAITAITVVLTSMILSPALIVGMVLRHREKMAAMKQKRDAAPPSLVEEVAALRQDVLGLRDTTTRFDMSFDAALHRVEERLNVLEETATTVPTATPPARTWTAPAEEPQVQVLNRPR